MKRRWMGTLVGAVLGGVLAHFGLAACGNGSNGTSFTNANADPSTCQQWAVLEFVPPYPNAGPPAVEGGDASSLMPEGWEPFFVFGSTHYVRKCIK